MAIRGQRLEVSFALQDAFGEELFERIESGLPSGFIFQFKLQRDNKRWFDRELDSSRLQVVAMYNAVTREYLVNYKQNGKLVASRVLRSRDELESAMTRFQSHSLFDLAGTGGRRRLLVRARARLGSRNILSIIPSSIHTDWVESRKFRVPEVLP